MNYEEEYAKAKEAEAVTEVTRNIQSWSEEGQTLTGKVVEIGPFNEGTFDTEVNAYLIDTDDGQISTVLGSATDKQLEKLDLMGKLIHIEYRGKKQLADGKQVNHFKIMVW